MKIKFLKAFNGDSILLSYLEDNEKPKNILIDGGIGWTYKNPKGPKGKPQYNELKDVIDTIRSKSEFIDLLIITHIDKDHIEGILSWFNDDDNADNLVKKVWFNSGNIISKFLNKPENMDLNHKISNEGSLQTSISHGIEFSKYLSEKGILEQRLILQGDILHFESLKFRILSPNREKLEKLLIEWRKKEPELETSKPNDYSLSLKDHISSDKFEEDSALPNGSSIAFILTYKGKDLLFLGDSHPSIIVKGLTFFDYSLEKPLPVEFVKMSHHGSKKNTSVELLELIDSENYIISTNGKEHNHPHKQLIARLINLKNDCNIYFNYPELIDRIITKTDKTEYPNFKVAGLKNNEFDI